MGYLYALLAAICNSSIGVISCMGFRTLTFYQVSFFKCFIAFIIISLLTAFSAKLRKEVKILYKEKLKIFVLAFFGVFLLYFFETKSFTMAPVGVVVFIVYSAGILTIILGCIFLKEKITLRKVLCLALIIAGASVIFGNFSHAPIDSLIYGLIGGCGYSIFLILYKKFAIKENLGFLWWLMFFGTIYLSIPGIVQIEELRIPDSNFLALTALAIIPTLGGFYFTSRALNAVEASKVQIIEMSDPLFSTLLAYVFLGQLMTLEEITGGVMVIFGLFLITRAGNKAKINKQQKQNIVNST